MTCRIKNQMQQHNSNQICIRIQFANFRLYFTFSHLLSKFTKSINVIDFIMHRENLSKHEAIKKAQEILNTNSGNLTVSREQFLTNIFTYFRNAINNSKPAKEYWIKEGLILREQKSATTLPNSITVNEKLKSY